MRDFETIFDVAAGRHGGADAIEAKFTPMKSAVALAAIPEDRWLSQFTRSIFQAGFNWTVIDAKWDGFEATFDGFDAEALAFADDARFDAWLQDTRIVRNGTKIAAVRDNASFILSLRERGGVSQVIADWPGADFIGLLDMLKTKGARLGGTSAQYALRSMGRDGFVLGQDVVARLIAEGVIDKPPTSKTAMRAVQAAFNTWHDQSGRGLAEISRTLALSV